MENLSAESGPKIVTPDDLMREITGLSLEEIIKLPAKEQIKLQPEITEYHNKVDKDSALEAKFAKCLSDYIAGSWTGEEIATKPSKTITAEEHAKELEYLKKKEIHPERNWYNNFHQAFRLDVSKDMDIVTRRIFKRLYLLGQDFVDLQISNKELAHLIIHLLFRFAQSYQSWELSKSNPELFGNHKKNEENERLKFNPDPIFQTMLIRLIKEKNYLNGPEYGPLTS